jgi:antitoxin component YwqK of YwqJK toxin-antitoxin module
MIVKRYDLLGNLLAKGEANDNNEPHGYWERYTSDGDIWYKGYYDDGNLIGYWERLMPFSRLRRKEFYI